ncbi:MAG: hypothetical protein WDZ28_04545 [Simkaniaceae bacterium]
MKKFFLSFFLSLSILRGASCLDFHNYSKLWLGPQFFHLHLGVEELNTYKGYLGGAAAGFERKYIWDLYVNLNGSYALGNLSGNGGRSRYIHDEYVEGLFGLSIPLSCQCNWVLTPYLGYGFTFVDHHLSAPNLSSLKFRYSKYYLPIGFILDYTPFDFWNIGLDFKWMPQIDPLLKIVELSGGRWELAHKQGYMVKLPLSFELYEKNQTFWSLTLTPFWRWTKDGSTQAVTNNGTPLDIVENLYIYWGAQAAFAIHF